MLAFQIGAGGELGLANIASPTGDPDTTRALKQRARELERMGLARETRRNVLAFQADWHDRLKAMELHLDIRKRICSQRSAARTPSPSIERIARGLLGR